MKKIDLSTPPTSAEAPVPTVVETASKQSTAQQQLQIASRAKWLSGTWTGRYPDIVHSKAWVVESTKARKSFPTVSMGRKKKRRLSVELRRTNHPHLSQDIDDDDDVEVGLPDWNDVIDEGDMIVVRLLKKMKESNSVFKGSVAGVPSSSSSVGSSDSVSSIGFLAVDNDYLDIANIMDDQWLESFVVPISKLKIAKIDKNKCVVAMGRTSSREDYVLTFQNEEKAQNFKGFIEKIQDTVRSTCINSIQQFIPFDPVDEYELPIPITILFEIVSATDIMLYGRDNSDPYAVAFFGGEEVHRTSIISKTSEPIWTLKTQSLFTFTFFPEDLYCSEFIIEVRDSNFQEDVKLGQVLIPNKSLLMGSGERVELDLKYVLNKFEDVKGHLVVRYKQASENEVQFMTNAAKNKKPTVINNYITPRVPTGPRSVVTKKMFPDGKKRIAFPLKNREEQWMTSREIDVCAREESELWIDAGSGDLGVLYLEVIGCDDIPNLDRAFPNEKTNCFITTIFEDTIVSTDVIMNCSSPRFLPWTRRAFHFNIKHAMSPLFIGVFDHDNRMNFNHDYIGRVVLNPSQFAANTAYNVTYELYDSHQMKKRSMRGTITLRIRVDWKDPGKLYFDDIGAPDQFHVNIESKKEYRFVMDVVKGRPDYEKYSISTLMAYGQEVRSYFLMVVHAKNALKSILLWRGHYEINFCNCLRFKIPLNSMILFCLGIIVAEKPILGPSAFFFVIAWIMLSLSANQQSRPSPWNKPRSYTDLFFSFIFGRKQRLSIEPYEKHQEDINFTSDLRAQKKASGQEVESFFDRVMYDMKELEKAKKTEDDAMSSKKNLFSTPNMVPFESVLYPVQLQTAEIVSIIRYIKGILNWSYSTISFWITTGAIILSILSFLMYDAAMHWILRVIVWLFFGPWMKLVDIFYFQKVDNMTKSEKEMYTKAKEKRRRKKVRSELRQMEENVMQLAAMKQHLFGTYILPVPSWKKPERYQSAPLPKSSAYPCDVKKLESVPKKRLMGQSIDDKMIPENYQAFVKTKEMNRSIISTASFPKNPFKRTSSNDESESLLEQSKSTDSKESGRDYGAIGRIARNRFTK